MAFTSFIVLGRATTIGLAVVTAAFLAVAGVEGSSRLVSPNEPDRPCRTPASYGWAYEAINYDQATDAQLVGRSGTDCRTAGGEAGTAVVATDGVPIAGWWIPAANPIGPRGPTVVMVHGYANDKHGMLEIAHVMHGRYNLVLFDLRNAGQSGGTITTQGVSEQQDVAAILDWLVTTKGPRQIAVFGQSMGGAAALRAVVHDPRVDAVILDSTHDRLRTAIVNAMSYAGVPFHEGAVPAIHLGAWLRSGKDLMSADPLDVIGRLGQRPVLIVHGGRDALDPLRAAQRLQVVAEAAGVSAEMRVCESGRHGQLLEACPDQYQAWLTNFLARNLVDHGAPLARP